MNNRKQEKANRLFYAIGEINDALIAEALTMPKRKRTPLSRIILIAASLSLVLVLSVSAFAVAMRGLIREDIGEPSTDDDSSLSHPPLEQTFEESMLALRDTGRYITVKEESMLPFFDSGSYLVWQYESGGDYYVSRKLTADEAREVENGPDAAERVGESSPAQFFRLWIIRSDGSVVSPYLETTAGNLSYGTLFDYETELIPSDDYSSYLLGILD